MIPREIHADVRRHCEGKGYREGPGVKFDRYVAVAPEGHIYGHLGQFSPASVAVYLGHTKGIQHLRNVAAVYLAEDRLDERRRQDPQ
jgi:hypothetical protein